MISPLYYITTITCFLLLLLIFVQSIVVKKVTDYKIKKSFIRLLVCSIIFMLNDSIWGIISVHSESYSYGLFIVSSIFHILLNLNIYFWVDFCIESFGDEIKYPNILKIITLSFVFASIVLICINYFRPIVFYISEAGEYVVLPVRNWIFILQYFLYFIVAFISLCFFIKNKGSKATRFIIVFSTTLPPLLCAAFQYNFVNYPFHTIGYLFTCGIVHLFIVSKEHFDLSKEKNLELKELLLTMTDEYDTLFIIDLDSGEEKLLRDKANLLDLNFQQFQNMEFEERVTYFANNYVAPQNRDEFISSMSTRVIWNKICKQKQYYVIYQVLVNGDPKWFETTFINLNDKSDKRLCVLGFRNIDREMNEELNVRGQIQKGQEILEEQFEILSSFAKIYVYVNVLNFVNSTILRFNSDDQNVESIDLNKIHQSSLNIKLREYIVDSQKDDFNNFTDIQTIRSRLSDGKKIISAEFLNTSGKWIRLQYIVVNRNSDNEIERVLYTVQDIDEEKKRELQIIHKSEIDEITGLLNRKAYERQIYEYEKEPLPDNFVFASIDINGLKETNDNLGHEAGDELLKAASFCLKKTFGSFGNVFRIGGDEFVALFFADSKELNFIKHDLNNNLIAGISPNIKEISLATGYVRKKEFPDMNINYLAKLADKRMYKSKNAYYENRGVDRRGLQVAYSVLCKTFARILKVDLTKDVYTVIRVDGKDLVSSVKHEDSFYELITSFGNSDSIHPDDRKQFLKSVNRDKLEEEFSSSKGHFIFNYRRKFESDYKWAYMEIVPSKEFSPKHKVVFVYVKYTE